MFEPATEPNDLEKLFVERANAADLEGLMALYEPGAVVSNSEGEVATGAEEIRELLGRMLSTHTHLEPSDQSPALVSGDIALTSSRLANGDITAEVARRRSDGSWRWVVDQFYLGKVEGES